MHPLYRNRKPTSQQELSNCNHFAHRLRILTYFTHYTQKKAVVKLLKLLRCVREQFAFGNKNIDPKTVWNRIQCVTFKIFLEKKTWKIFSEIFILYLTFDCYLLEKFQIRQSKESRRGNRKLSDDCSLSMIFHFETVSWCNLFSRI